MNTLTCGYVPLGSGMVRSWELRFCRWPEAGSSCNLPGSKVAFLQVVGRGVPGMSAGGPLFEKSRSIEDLQQMRLLVLLEETVRDKGVMRAAQDLNVDHRTVAVSLETGRLSRRMRGALEKALLEGGGSPAREQRERNDALAGRVEKLEGQVEEMGKGMNQGLAAVQGEVKELREAQERGMRRLERLEGSGDDQDGDAEGNEESGGGAAASTRPLSAGRRSPPRLRREFPELVTVHPAEDDEAVFGEAWGLIQEWRGLKDSHASRGKGLDWLRVEERLLTVELALLEDHGLTLPPETYPLKGLDRSGQVNWRRKALEDTQKARKRRELLAGLWRAATFPLRRR